MNRLTRTALGLAVAVIVVLSVLLKGQRKQRLRFEQNQHMLLQDVEYYKSREGQNVASVEQLRLTNSEFRESQAAALATIKSLKLKLSRVNSLATTATESNYEILDTLVKQDSLLRLDYKTPYIELQAQIKNVNMAQKFDSSRSGGLFQDTANASAKVSVISLNIRTYDTLTQIVHRVPRRFWFIRWGTKAIRQEIVSTNPHTKLTYAKCIELE